MPYVRRNSQGDITAIYREPEPGADEFLPAHSGELAEFFGQSGDAAQFQELDISLIRVLEDLIDVMIQKNQLRLTDLPPPAQQKLLSRKNLRRSLANQLNFTISPDDGVI
ncbi:hypothetical protein [Chitinilyticum piscinae]|uniref:Tryptophan synthase subunit beta like protein n=1 Tax=Chitinilyticum piscinae TaxID=2866724 RepID=A0A8J7G2B5_9NEIS|nr:hypothetical protein [Chitinilyticum piscinae]MBE9610103.1 hypothetical protein [Chitinilyticum piscinae]